MRKMKIETTFQSTCKPQRSGKRQPSEEFELTANSLGAHTKLTESSPGNLINLIDKIVHHYVH